MSTRAAASVIFLVGLVLAVRVMFFGVRRVEGGHLAHSRWPLALAALLVFGGATLYATSSGAGGVTPAEVGLVVLLGGVAGLGAWWLVRRSAAVPSTDPEDDPRYRFQGHVARITQEIGGTDGIGRVALEFDGERHDFRARWAVDGVARSAATAGSEVVIERVEEDVAYVEPWTAVENRL